MSKSKSLNQHNVMKIVRNCCNEIFKDFIARFVTSDNPLMCS